MCARLKSNVKEVFGLRISYMEMVVDKFYILKAVFAGCDVYSTTIVMLEG